MGVGVGAWKGVSEVWGQGRGGQGTRAMAEFALSSSLSVTEAMDG